MFPALTKEQSQWVENTIESMSIEEYVGQLICPEDRDYTPQRWAEIIKEVPLGSVFLGVTTPENTKACTEAIQGNSKIPVLVSSDLERGLGSLVEGSVEFPHQMACGAANDIESMEQIGRAMAKDARSLGYHWSFSPVVDLNINFNNPVTNIRSFGDKPEHVSAIVSALIKGMQTDGLLAACAKHFPGDGLDDRDQHLCTAINSYSSEQWDATYGKVWKSAIDAGLYSVMVGHISLPAYQGCQDNPAAAMPATISKELQIDLLRKKLGFEGVIISDAAPMVGLTSRVPSNELAIQNILTGSDILLFARPIEDYKLLLEAVKNGKLPLEQVKACVRRILEMKARLQINKDCFGCGLTETEMQSYKETIAKVADNSITIARSNGTEIGGLESNAKILTVTIKYVNKGREDLAPELEVVDAELRKRGCHVDHLLNPPHNELIKRSPDYDRVFLNIVIGPHARAGTMRLTGEIVMPFWRAFWVDSPNVTFTSFGSPYHLYELPHLPNMILAYSACEFSQKAAVKVWLGEIHANGKCPVKLPW